jgi:U3 small nucleolar RNA-associated protein 11
MQRLLMGRGARRKLRGVEKVESGEDDEDPEDDDSRKKKPAANEKLYKPRVYKWRQERKR